MSTLINIFSLVGSLALFLYGMKIMSEGLEKFAGDRLRSILGAMTKNRLMGVLTGVGITALIQSSSATTVMVVSFVNAGLMTLRQSIGVIMEPTSAPRSRHGCSASAASTAAASGCVCSSRPPLRRCSRSSASFSTCSARTAAKRTPA